MTKTTPLRVSLSAMALIAAAAPATGEASFALSLDIGGQDTVRAVRYSCADGTELNVQYINAGANALAIMPLGGEELIFVNVVAASGARYVNGTREWWTKGDDASLRDTASDADAVECTDASSAEGD